MSKRQSPNTAQPIVQRLRLRYSKSGRMRFASHRDFQRALERAVRRAGLPIAFSGGFTPHPRISYANAAPTGAASRAEYVELGMRDPVDPEGIPAALTAALPAGIAIEACVRAAPGSLADRLQASRWQLELAPTTVAEAAEAVRRLLQLHDVTVRRTTKSGVKQIPVGAALVAGEAVAADEAAHVATACADAPCAILQVVVRHVTPAVRPEDVLTALVERADLQAPASVVYTRLAQGPLRGDPARVADPFSETG